MICKYYVATTHEHAHVRQMRATSEAQAKLNASEVVACFAAAQ